MPTNLILAGKTLIITKYETNKLDDRLFLQTEIFNPIKTSPYQLLPKHTLSYHHEVNMLEGVYREYLSRGKKKVPKYVDMQLKRFKTSITKYNKWSENSKHTIQPEDKLYYANFKSVYDFLKRGYNYINDPQYNNEIMYTAEYDKDSYTIIKDDHVVSIEFNLDTERFQFLDIIVTIQERNTDTIPITYYEHKEILDLVPLQQKNKPLDVVDLILNILEGYMIPPNKEHEAKQLTNSKWYKDYYLANNKHSNNSHNNNSNSLEWGSAFIYSPDESPEEHKAKLVKLKEDLLKYEANELTYDELHQELKDKHFIQELSTAQKEPPLPQVLELDHIKRLVKPTVRRVVEGFKIIYDNRQSAYFDSIQLQDTTFISKLVTK